MFSKLVDVLKEVFWIKTKKKKSSPSPKRRLTVQKTAKKKTLSKKTKPDLKPKKPGLVLEKKAVSVRAPKPAKVKVPLIDPNLTEVGVITQYFERIHVAVLRIRQGTVLIGDKVHIIGLKTKFSQKMWSMQVDRQDIKVAKKGEDIGFKVDKAVEVGDKVYKS